MFGQGFPIWWPTEFDSWDMAFELTTQSGESEWKWTQMPDELDTGLDVMNFGNPGVGLITYWLADDWLCGATGSLTDIYVIGSWLNDNVPQNPTGTHGNFTVAIYADIPAGTGGVPYSRPGDLQWMDTFGPQGRPYTTALWLDGVYEQFYDPGEGQAVGADSQMWMYYFHVDPAEAFVQEEGTIYWLAVINWDPNEDGVLDFSDLNFLYGWKTRWPQYHYNDDAVYSSNGDIYNPPVPPASGWNEMRYPSGHQWAGASIDLAFELWNGGGDTWTKWSQTAGAVLPR